MEKLSVADRPNNSRTWGQSLNVRFDGQFVEVNVSCDELNGPKQHVWLSDRERAVGPE